MTIRNALTVKPTAVYAQNVRMKDVFDAMPMPNASTFVTVVTTIDGRTRRNVVV